MGRCTERSGFLFAHDCDQPAFETCATCSKAMCRDHTHAVVGGMVCSSCAKAAARREQRRRPADRRDSRSRDDGFDNSPYFYGPAYYGFGYGHYGPGLWGSDHLDRNDFTEADGGSLSGGAGEGFEDDVGGS